MMRLLFWCVIAVLVYAGLRKIADDRSRGGPPPAPPPGAGGSPGPGGTPGAAENMVRCRVCGLNLPQSEALRVGAQWACCAEHARAPGSPG